MSQLTYQAWPALPYEEFKTTAHLLHMAAQILGKFKLQTPFEPHWANVVLFLTSRGVTTGPIPYQSAAFSFDIDFIDHQIIVNSSWGVHEKLNLETMSVAQLTEKIFKLLAHAKIDLKINLMPQEIAHPIPFDQDKEQRLYNPDLANAWWRILLSSYQVLQKYHARFDGESPPVGLMWGTFDLRDARYNGKHVPTTGANAGYIRRNAMNEAQIEMGWWHGNENYPQAAYYAFTYPQPESIENAKILPSAAKWDKKLGEFILDYEIVRRSNNPEKDLLDFFESTYQAGEKYAQWNPELITNGEPA